MLEYSRASTGIVQRSRGRGDGGLAADDGRIVRYVRHPCDCVRSGTEFCRGWRQRTVERRVETGVL